jgi:hypothetical protein
LRVATLVGLPVLTLELEGVDGLEGLEGLEAVVGELAVVGVDEDLEELPHAAMANPAKAIAATDIRRFNGHLARSSVGWSSAAGPRHLPAPRGRKGRAYRQAHDQPSTRCIDALNVGQLNNAQVA